MFNRLVMIGTLALLPSLALAQEKSVEELKKENERLRKLNAKLNKGFAKYRKETRKTITDLRKQLSTSEDTALDLARNFDTEKKRLQDEKELVLKELVRFRRDHALQVARLETELAALQAKLKGGANDPLKLPVTVSFSETPLVKVLGFLTDATKVRHRLAPADAGLGKSVQVSLRLKGIALQDALNLIAASAQRLSWRKVGNQVVFSTKPQLLYSPSGLGSLDLVVGKGAVAKTGSKVTVHYVGTLKSGVVFDSSRTRGTPFTFVVGKRKVIEGWDEGVQGMRVGGKRKLVVPPGQGYGKRGFPGKIPPNATLTFEVELLKVE